MIEALALPILTKAVDFLFEEGRQILAERRSRRQQDDVSTDSSAGLENVKQTKAEDSSISSSQVISSKQIALSQAVEESLWLTHKTEIQHLVSLMDIYTRNYHLAKEAYAQWGKALVPAIVVHRLEEAENNVVDTMEQLQRQLQSIYGKPIDIVE